MNQEHAWYWGWTTLDELARRARGIVDRGFTAPGWDPFGYAGLAPDERGVSGGGAARYTDDWQAGRQAGLAESVGRGG